MNAFKLLRSNAERSRRSATASVALRKWRCLPRVLALCAALPGLSLPAAEVPQAGERDPLANWTPLATAANLQAVAYLNGRYLAGGDLGTLLTSLDGADWTLLDATKISHLNGFGYGAEVWVAVGPRGQIITSKDGLSWTLQWSGVAAHLQSVAYGNGRFVAVGGIGSTPSRAVLTSTDGERWIVRELSPDRPALWKVLFQNDRFVAVGNRGTLLASADGASWQSITNLAADRISGLAFGNGHLVALGDGGVLRSADGITWTNRFFPERNWFDLAFGAGRFVATGDDNLVWTSTNGWDWTVSQTGAEWPLGTVTFGDDQFVAVGQNGLITVSKDGLHWTHQASGSIPLTRQLALGNGRLAAIGDSAVRVGPRAFAVAVPLAVSADGKSWSYPLPAGEHGFFSVNFAGGAYLAFGHLNANPVQRVTAYSNDGISWRVEPLAGETAPMKVVHAEDLYVGVGNAFFVSPDGLHWTASNPRQSGLFTGLAYGNGLFVALDPNGHVFTSDSGTDWSQQPRTALGLTDLAYGNGLFVAVGSAGLHGTNTAVVSPDGVHWNPGALPADLVTLGNPPTLTSVAFGGGWFVAAGSSGTILTSRDGLSWTRRHSGVQSHLSSIAFANGRFVAVGNGGTVLESDNLLTAALAVVNADRGRTELVLTGQEGQVYRILAASDLGTSEWLDLGTVTNSVPRTAFLDAAAPQARRFYRAVLP